MSNRWTNFELRCQFRSINAYALEKFSVVVVVAAAAVVVAVAAIVVVVAAAAVVVAAAAAAVVVVVVVVVAAAAAAVVVVVVVRERRRKRRRKTKVWKPRGKGGRLIRLKRRTMRKTRFFIYEGDRKHRCF